MIDKIDLKSGGVGSWLWDPGGRASASADRGKGSGGGVCVPERLG